MLEAIIITILCLFVLSILFGPFSSDSKERLNNNKKKGLTYKSVSDPNNKETTLSEFTKQWKAILATGVIKGDYELIYQSFFLKDRIDPNKFMANFRANEYVNFSGIQIGEILTGIKAEPTPSFKKYYSNDILNRGISVPDWYYICYPDVAQWADSNDSIIDKLFRDREHEVIRNDSLTAIYYRDVIDYYKNNINKLECSIEN